MLQEFDIVRFIKGVVDSFKHKAVQKHLHIEIKIDTDVAGENLFYITDPDKLYFIVSNLLANAIEYTENGKRVKIVARKYDSRLIIIVEDEGSGIAEEHMDRIFERFVQLDTGLKKKHKGHGLGLSITRALVEMLDGSIILSRSESKGSVFTVSVNEMNYYGISGNVSENGNDIIFDGAQTY